MIFLGVVPLALPFVVGLSFHIVPLALFTAMAGGTYLAGI